MEPFKVCKKFTLEYHTEVLASRLDYDVKSSTEMREQGGVAAGRFGARNFRQAARNLFIPCEGKVMHRYALTAGGIHT